jgi:hypothetical protein
MPSFVYSTLSNKNFLSHQLVYVLIKSDDVC